MDRVAYFVSTEAVKPKGWLPWVGEEPPRSHILNQSGRSMLGWSLHQPHLQLNSPAQVSSGKSAPSNRGQTLVNGFGLLGGAVRKNVPCPRRWLHLRPKMTAVKACGHNGARCLGFQGKLGTCIL